MYILLRLRARYTARGQKCVKRSSFSPRCRRQTRALPYPPLFRYVWKILYVQRVCESPSPLVPCSAVESSLPQTVFYSFSFFTRYYYTCVGWKRDEWRTGTRREYFEIFNLLLVKLGTRALQKPYRTDTSKTYEYYYYFTRRPSGSAAVRAHIRRDVNSCIQ